MKWSIDAEREISKVPFFMRKKVRKRVEEEAIRSGSGEVRIEHVKSCQRRFLENMEDDVKGYQVDTCFGQMGCPNSVFSSDGIAEKIEEMMSRRNMKDFLKERVKGPLKIHHEFRVSISNCPNACSRPQIVDIGLIGARKPKVSNEKCIFCMRCVVVCKEGAISIDNDSNAPIIDYEKCLGCGHCLNVCPTKTLDEEITGYRVLVGGKLGRHPQFGMELSGIYGSGEVREVISHFIDFYQQNCKEGERLGEIINKIGWNSSIEKRKEFDDKK